MAIRTNQHSLIVNDLNLCFSEKEGIPADRCAAVLDFKPMAIIDSHKELDADRTRKITEDGDSPKRP